VALLPLPQPYSFELSTERFRAFGRDLANLWEDGALLRVFDGEEVRLAEAPGGVDAEPLHHAAGGGVARFLGLPFDLDGFRAFAARDDVLGPLEQRLRGFRPPLVPDPWESLVTSITAQQVSLYSAFAIRNRLIERFGVPVGRAWAFPTRARLAAATEEGVVAVGFSRRKAEYVVGLARSGLDLDALAALPDEEVTARITAQRGLGEWTAGWFLARHLGRPTAWPAGDLGLRKAVERFLPGVDVREAGARFHPFQNLAAHYLLLGLRTP
jgi:DNA-3-methyladenine glycosylase II